MKYAVHYKYQSSENYRHVFFDGFKISVANLKRSIADQDRFGSNVELMITNAQTKEEFSRDDVMIRHGTLVFVTIVRMQEPGKEKRPQHKQMQSAPAGGRRGPQHDPWDPKALAATPTVPVHVFQPHPSVQRTFHHRAQNSAHRFSRSPRASKMSPGGRSASRFAQSQGPQRFDLRAVALYSRPLPHHSSQSRKRSHSPSSTPPPVKRVRQ